MKVKTYVQKYGEAIVKAIETKTISDSIKEICLDLTNEVKNKFLNKTAADGKRPNIIDLSKEFENVNNKWN